MKKLISLALAALLVLTMLPAFAATEEYGWYGDGSASEFTISSAAELVGLASLVNSDTTFKGKVIRLGADIDLKGSAWSLPIGDIYHYFMGEFDGQGHIISGLNSTAPHTTGDNVKVAYMGLFGYTRDAYIHSFTLSGANLGYTGDAGEVHCGTVAAYAHYSVFKDITVTEPTLTINPTGGQKILAGGAFGRFSNSQAENVNVESPTVNATCSEADSEKRIGGHTGMSEDGNVDKDGTIGEKVRFGSNETYYSHNAHWLPGTVSEGDKVALNVFRSCHVTGSEAKPATITATGYNLSVGGFLGSDTDVSGNTKSDLFSDCTVSGLALTLTGKSQNDAGICTGSIAGGFAGWIDSNNAVSSGSVFIRGFEGCSASGTMTINAPQNKKDDTTSTPVYRCELAQDCGFGGFVGVSGYRYNPSYQGADASGMTINIADSIKYKNGDTYTEADPNKRAGSFVGSSQRSTYMGCTGGTPGTKTSALNFVGEDGAGGNSSTLSGLKITPALRDLGTHVVQSYSGAVGTFTLENIGEEAYYLNIPTETAHFNISCGPETGESSPADSPVVASLTDGVTIAPGKSCILTVTPKEGLEIGRYTDTIDIKTTGEKGELLGVVAATIEIIAPSVPTSGGIDLWYNGGNSFGSSKSAVPTSVEIDGQPVGFVGDGSEFSVSCLQPGAKWVTVKWHSTTVTTSFTPDINAHCNSVAIPKTGDMPLLASILAWLGL